MTIEDSEELLQKAKEIQKISYKIRTYKRAIAHLKSTSKVSMLIKNGVGGEEVYIPSISLSTENLRDFHGMFQREKQAAEEELEELS